MQYPSFYDLKAKTIKGGEFLFSELIGKKVLIVNTASQCGLTPQLGGLQKLHEEYEDQLTIIGFPCNDFKQQDSASNEEINSFCLINFSVDFLMMEKISIKENTHPVYQWLTKKELNGKSNSKVWWNFQKYLINEDGTFHDYLFPWRQPDSPKIINWLKLK
ncbi:MAG: glutathione peroxidase [Bacteroidetes bacterium]|jgi:glutathione peroxidase|nr:glutathione peroxidase [Bacteroidota bacterium]MCA6444242.1 glutathione peroxidase [Bacteroidota bacterium]